MQDSAKNREKLCKIKSHLSWYDKLFVWFHFLIDKMQVIKKKVTK